METDLGGWLCFGGVVRTVGVSRVSATTQTLPPLTVPLLLLSLLLLPSLLLVL